MDGLEDRLVETGADWWTAPPEGQGVARDRAAASAAGIRQGAPEAVQVAARWHLLSTLADALHAGCNAHSQDRGALYEATRPAPVPRDADAVAAPMAPPGARAKKRQPIAPHRARRLAPDEQGWA
jgi:transposase